MDTVHSEEYNALFTRLDEDRDGVLTTADLESAAVRLGWYWPEAPVYALLHLAALNQSLTPDRFAVICHKMHQHVMGPYSDILLEITRDAHTVDAGNPAPTGPSQDNMEAIEPAYSGILESVLNTDIADRIAACMTTEISVEPSKTVLLIIDPQYAFTAGTWMQSIGSGGYDDVALIRTAFDRCGRLLCNPAITPPIMVTRCPFPPESYSWDRRVANALGPDHPYFIKPGNSVLRPRTNGFASAITARLARSPFTLVIGGCTLNSCVRVSACDLMKAFGNEGLNVIVDISLCGARVRNYRPSREFNGRSSVEAAVDEMVKIGVIVTDHLDWM